MAAAGVGRDEVRRANLHALLQRVHLDGATSRADLTEALRLNRSTIGDLTAQLESLGLVREEVPDGATPGVRRTGRPSLVVVPRSDVCVLAVALDVDRITAALVGLGGDVLFRSFRMHQRGGHDVAAVVEAVALQCQELLEQAGPLRCLSAGISVPGMVRQSDGLVHFAPNLGWVDQPFAQLMQQRLHLPVVVGNDASLGAMAELLRGAARGHQEVAFVSGTVGIGGGFITRGQLVRGASGYAGEVGHLPVDTNGSTCRCGAVGCWETKIGEGPLLVGAGRLPGGGPAAVQEVIDSARAEDPRAMRSLEDVAVWTGIGLRSVLAIFNPEVVVLGGVLATVWAERPELVLDGLDRRSRLAMRSDAEIVVAALGQDTALVGAAELAFAPLLGDPAAVAGAEEPAASHA